MQILDITQHLSMRYFLYEMVTNHCTYFIRVEFDEKDILISKSGLEEPTNVDPIEFLTLLKRSTVISKELSDVDLREFFIQILSEKFLWKKRNESIDKLIN